MMADRLQVGWLRNTERRVGRARGNIDTKFAVNLVSMSTAGHSAYVWIAAESVPL